jgi:hypothetical protein
MYGLAEDAFGDLMAEFQCKAIALHLLFRGDDGVLIPSEKLMRWAANAAIKSLASDRGLSTEESRQKVGESLHVVPNTSKFGHLLRRINMEGYERVIEWMDRQLVV